MTALKFARVSMLLFCFVAISSAGEAAECYEAAIVKPSPFMGNNGEIFQLDDGTIWEVKYEYEYLYEYYPTVIVCPGRGLIVIDDKQLNVEQLR